MKKNRPKKENASATLSRKGFLKLGALTAVGMSVMAKRAPAQEDRPTGKVLPERPVRKDDAMGRMENDVRRAMSKPIHQRHWVMVLDLLKCIGCDACTLACKAENVTPPGVAYTIVMKEEVGTYPNVRRRFIPRPCMQCQKSPCTKVCPVKATFEREDGIVAIDYDECIGCKYCVNACPYGARYSDHGDYYTSHTPKLEAYEQRPNFEYGKLWPREGHKSPIGNARKCHFCLHRLRKGILPACIVSCMGRSRYFGDINDPESLVSELIGRYRATRLREDFGTEPSVYYIS